MSMRYEEPKKPTKPTKPRKPTDEPLKKFMAQMANHGMVSIAKKKNSNYAPMNPITDPELRSEFGDTNPDAITAPSFQGYGKNASSSMILNTLKNNMSTQNTYSQQKQKAYTEASNAELAARTNRESDVNNKLRKQMLLKLLTGSTLQGKTLLGA